MSDNGPSPSPSLDLRAAMDAALGPIRENLAVLNRRIEQSESELADLRKLRSDAERIIRAIDPEATPRKKPGPRPGRNRDQKRNVSEAKVNAVETWLRANMRADQGFSVAGINNQREELGFHEVPKGTLAFVFAALHNQGVIRFDSIGPHGSKIYKLVES